MKLLFVRHSKNFLDEMIPKLIPLGVELYSADTKEEIEEWIKGKKNSSIFFNINEDDYNWAQYIEELKNKDENNSLKIAVYLPQNNHKCLRKLYKAGITAFIYKSSITDHVMTQMLSIIRFLEQEGERRGHVRINLKKEENVKIKFSINNKEINGTVIKISPIALSFEPPYKEILLSIEKKEIIKDIKVTFPQGTVSTDAIVVHNENNTALMFVNIKTDFLNMLCSFIFKKLNEKETN